MRFSGISLWEGGRDISFPFFHGHLRGTIQPMTKLRILCLEDDEDTCELVVAMLTPYGYEVITASSVKEALRLIETNGFSLYIVDERLPDCDGLEFIRKVRQSDSITPILVHSAAAYKKDMDDVIAAGANDYLVKPNGWSTLNQTVTKLLRQSQSAG